jgi:hypothetical protein
MGHVQKRLVISKQFARSAYYMLENRVEQMLGSFELLQAAQGNGCN